MSSKEANTELHIPDGKAQTSRGTIHFPYFNLITKVHCILNVYYLGDLDVKFLARQQQALELIVYFVLNNYIHFKPYHN